MIFLTLMSSVFWVIFVNIVDAQILPVKHLHLFITN